MAATLVDKLRHVLHEEVQHSEATEEGSVHDPTKPFLLKQRTEGMRLVDEYGKAVMLWNPILNRGTNFTQEEREQKGLEGLLPAVYESIELQGERVMMQLRNECSNGIMKYELLAELAARNVTLFYHVLINNLTELAPVVYTPVVGEACQTFDRIYSTPQGMYFSGFTQRGRYRRMLDNWHSKSVQIIVVTDGGRILGLGDLGTNGVGISIGKIELYVAGAGFHPEHSLPAVLDMGTNNKELLEDKFYLGMKKPRLDGDEHMAVVEEFLMAVKDKWPNCLVQFEDFQTDKAFAILDKFRDKLLCFNDDIQGTGAIVAAGFINGMKAQGTELKDARIVFYGAGSSAVGVAQSIGNAIHTLGGVPKEDMLKGIYMVDTKGLITMSRGDDLPEHKKAAARRDDTPNIKELKDIVEYVKPHALIGLTGAGPSFDKDIVEELCKHQEHPLIFPLSNPTSKAEITAENAYNWSNCSCLFASGSPFDPVTCGDKTFYPGQGNNAFVFPGVGFGSVMVKAKQVTDKMFAAAALAVADYVSEDELKAGKLYPNMEDLRKVSLQVAAATAKAAFDDGVAGIPKPDDLEKYMEERMWMPGNSVMEPHS